MVLYVSRIVVEVRAHGSFYVIRRVVIYVQPALDATLSTFLSKHLLNLLQQLFHDACIMESKHKNI